MPTGARNAFRRLFAPFPDSGGTLPPVYGRITDDSSLKLALGELTRQVDQQWQASDQLAQRAGVVLGLFVAVIAGLLAIARRLPSGPTWFDAATAVVILSAIGLSVYATRAQDIRLGPLRRDVVTQASAPSIRQSRFNLLGLRLDDLTSNSRILNRSAAA